MINSSRILEEFFEFVKIKSSTRAERQAGDLLKVRLDEVEAETMEDSVGEKIGGNCGNILAYIKGNIPGAPTVMFSAHLDCVEPCACIQPVLRDGIITAAGDTVLGADNKAGVVAILEAMRVIHERKIPHGDIQLVFTVAEEGGLHGSKNLDPNLLRADLGYVLDAGSPPGQIITMAPGQNSIVTIIHGKAAHAGIAPEEGLNAIIVAAHALANIKQGRIDRETTANVGIIHGGIGTNIVPEKVVILCEARSHNAVKLEHQTRHMCETFEQAAALTKGARAEVTIGRAYDAFVLAADAPVVSVAQQAALSVGLPAKLVATGGGSDANYFNHYGLPCAVLGIGMSKVHTTEEYIKEIDLYHNAQWVVAIVQQAAGILGCKL